MGLSLENVSVRFGGFTAVDGVSFMAPDRSITALIGPNGAGKTTTFNVVCGFVRPTNGRVLLDGEALPTGNPYRVWRRGIGRTFQQLNLFSTLTVEENIELARFRARRRRSDGPSVDELLELVSLKEYARQTAGALPLGIGRLVELGRALATGASLLLLDESSSGLDRHETDEFESVVQRTARELNLTVLLVEHDVEFVMSLADNVVVLDRGRVIANGSPAEIRTSTVVRDVYLGSMSGADNGR